MIEATKGEKTKEIALDLTKAARNDNEYGDSPSPKPVMDITPRDWTESSKKPESQTMRVARPAHH